MTKDLYKNCTDLTKELHMAKDELYIDVRFTFKRETEFEGEDPTLRPVAMKQQKVKGLTEDEVDQIGESFGQMDSYQDTAFSSLASVLAGDYKAKFN